MADLIEDKGAAIDAKDNDSRTLLFARDGYGWTPLSRAARRGHVAFVRLLFDKGAGIDAKDMGGRTPLSWAA
jgi:ankyrin repeat protein